MRLAPRLPLAALALWLAGAAGAAAQSTYGILVPPVIDPLNRFSVVVILHDAGGSGAAMLVDERIVEGFVDKGYAVLAPDAMVRQNRRFIARGAKPGPFASTRDRVRGRYSTKRFVMRGADGGVQALRWGVDNAWHYHNTDVIEYDGDSPETEFIGRDEIEFLRAALKESAQETPIDPEPVLIIGLGHGGSLVWDIACRAPDLARLLAPVDGAFWHDIPTDCERGANLIHTHFGAGEFWPLEGVDGNDKRYARTPVEGNIRMLLERYGCGPVPAQSDDDAFGATRSRWDDCLNGNPVELRLLEQPFDFQPAWFERIHARLDAFDLPQPFDTPDLPAEDSPQFSQPGEEGVPRLGTPDPEADSRFKKPDAEEGARLPGSEPSEPERAEAEPDEAEPAEPGAEPRPRFLKPDQTSPSRFKRPVGDAESPFKRVD